MKLNIVLPIIVLFLGLCIIIPLGIVRNIQEQAIENLEFKRISRIYSNYIENEFESFIQNGVIMHTAYRSNNNLTRSVHKDIAIDILNNRQGKQSIVWIKRVSHSNRIKEELSATLYFGSELFFHNFMGDRVLNSSEYYPIDMIYPVSGNAPSILLDLKTSPIWNFAYKSITSGTYQITTGFKLIQETGDQTGLIIFYPVYQGKPLSELERINQNIGLTDIVLRMQEWFEIRMSNIFVETISLFLIDGRDNKTLANIGGIDGKWTSVNITMYGQTIYNNITVGTTPFIVKIVKSENLLNSNYVIIFMIGLPVLVVMVILVFVVTLTFQQGVDQKNAIIDQERTLNQSKQTFVHYIFHEIRVPFQTIKLGLINLRQYLTTDKSNDTWTAINDCIDHASIILNDMLDVGKMESGKFAINPVPCMLLKNLKLLIDGFKMSIKMNGIDFNVNLDETLNTKLLTVDVKRLGQCLTNILSNASKYTFEGVIDLKIELVEKIYKNESEIWIINFEVKDTGIGIAAGDIPKIFQPYQQIQNQSQEIGTGLGLVITKNIIELHGGKISLTSIENVGSTFGFTIPVVVSDIVDSENDASSDIIVSIPENILNDSILIVDDNKHNRFSLGEFMKTLGFTNISYAINGVDALEVISSHKCFDIIFMDFHMPKMNGVECISEIRKEYPEKNYIIMVTGAYVDENDIMNMGANNILQKPLQINNFKKVLQEYGKE